MKLHYMGKYDLDPKSLPHGEHRNGTVRFKEAEDSKKLAVIASTIALAAVALAAVPAFLIHGEIIASNYWQVTIGILLSFVTMLPHELLHGICFKKDVYLYTNLKQGMMFVVGPEDMSKGRFIFMSLLPNIVFGVIPYAIGMLYPHLVVLTAMGVSCLSMGAGDYYNVFNALTQMPKGARTYLYQFNSYWYMPNE